MHRTYFSLISGFVVLIAGCAAPTQPRSRQQPAITSMENELAAHQQVTSFTANICYRGNAQRLILNVSRIFGRRPFSDEARYPDRPKISAEQKGRVEIVVRLNTELYSLEQFPAHITLHHRFRDENATMLAQWWIVGNKVYTSKPEALHYWFLVSTGEAFVTVSSSR